MRQLLIKHMVPAMLALIFVTAALPAVETSMHFWSRGTNAIDWYGVGVATPIIKPGDELKLVYKAKVNKQCPSDIRGFIVAPDGTVPIRMPVVTGGFTKPSDNIIEIPVSIMVPKESDAGLKPLESGTYKYRVSVTRYCPDGVQEDYLTPDASFRLDVPPE